jgi:2-polyprenyl-6-methoxyphenol hydroxylase-like FAD-dependent oxidoreductase
MASLSWRPEKASVLIVGGGVGGMSTALSLSALGMRVELIDIDPEWRVYGAGITITGPTLRAFKGLGVYEDICAQGYVGEEIQVCDVSGQPIRRLATPMPDGSGVHGSGGIMRPVLHNILSTRVRQAGVTVNLGVTVNELRQDGAGVEVTFSDERRARYDLVIGADGVYSKVRQLIFPNAPQPFYTGQSAWRVTTPRPPQVQCRHFYLGGPNKVGFSPVSNEQMYLFLLQKTPRMFRDEAELPGALRELLAGYGGYIAGIREGITADSLIVFRPMDAFFLPAPWYSGHVLLIGDAAHPTTPQLASGAGMAVEDALVLAQELPKAGCIPEALTRFMARREERCRLVVESSMKIGQLEQAAAPAAEQTAVVEKALAILSEPR